MNTCNAITSKGIKCKRTLKNGTTCFQHIKYEYNTQDINNYIYTYEEYQNFINSTKYIHSPQDKNLILQISSTASSSTCSICLLENSNNNDSKILSCGHKFHKNCIVLWKQLTCPVCRAKTNTSSDVASNRKNIGNSASSILSNSAIYTRTNNLHTFIYNRNGGGGATAQWL